MFGFLPLIGKNYKAHNKNYDTVKARVTYYTAAEDKRWGSRVAWQKVRHAKEGVTVAAERKIPFGTKVEIPELKKAGLGDGVFEVQDRGPHVNSRKASRGKTMVIDVYVKDRATMRRMIRKAPMYMNVRIYK